MATMLGDLVKRHRLTVDDYHHMAEAGILGPDDRVELIAGEVLDMSPIGSLHAALVAALSDYQGRLAAGRLTVWSQNPIRLDDLTEPQPDIALVMPRPDFYAAAHPGPADTRLFRGQHGTDRPSASANRRWFSSKVRNCLASIVRAAATCKMSKLRWPPVSVWAADRRVASSTTVARLHV